MLIYIYINNAIHYEEKKNVWHEMHEHKHGPMVFLK